MAVPVIGAPPQDQELRVDPMAELHRDAKFIDSTELTLVTPVQLEKLLKEKPAAGYFCFFAELRDKEIRQYDSLPVKSGPSAPFHNATYPGKLRHNRANTIRGSWASMRLTRSLTTYG